MKILICIFLWLVFIIMTSKIKINIKRLNRDEKSSQINHETNAGVYFLGIIKIFGITFKKDGIHFLFLKFPYPKMKFDKNTIKTPVFDILKKLDVKVEKCNINVEIGTENVMFTSFLVFAISTVLSNLPTSKFAKINLKNYSYNIMPMYNKNVLYFDITAVFSARFVVF